MRSTLSSVLVLLSASSVRAVSPAPNFDSRAFLNTAREAVSQNPMPELRGADQQVLEHVFRSYPKDRGECPESARKIAADFAAATGAETLGAVCLADGPRGFTIAVQYRAGGKLPLVSTMGRPSVSPSAGWESKQACEAALEEETARFKRNTGLTPAASYCYQEEYARKDEWTMRIDGFGTALSSPQLGGAYVFGKVLGHSRASFLAELRSGLERSGLDVSFVRYRASMAYGEIGVLYYAPERVRLESVEYAKVADAAQCAEQLDLARAALTDANEAISYCGAMSVTGNYEVSYLFAGNARKTTSHYKKFDSYASCMADRESELEHFRGQGRSVVGALCGRTDAGWGIVFLNGK